MYGVEVDYMILDELYILKGEEMGNFLTNDKEVFIIDNKTGETIGCGYLKSMEHYREYYGYEKLRLETQPYKMGEKPSYFFNIQKVIFSGPATIVFFVDGKKEVVKIADYLNPRFDDDRELAMMYCVLKHSMSGNGWWNKKLKRFRKTIESCDGKMTLAVEKAFIKEMVYSMHPQYIDQIEKALESAQQKGLLMQSDYNEDRLYLPKGVK